MRIELPDGQWADLRDRLTHGQVKEVIRATRADDIEFMSTVTRVFVRDWHVTDPDGNPIPVTDADAFDRIPNDTVVELYEHVRPLWKANNPAVSTNLAPTPPSSAA